MGAGPCIMSIPLPTKLASIPVIISSQHLRYTYMLTNLVGCRWSAASAPSHLIQACNIWKSNKRLVH